MKTFTHIDGDKLYVIVTDKYCGRRNRYTTYRINLSGMKSVKLIGRELTLSHSRTLR